MCRLAPFPVSGRHSHTWNLEEAGKLSYRGVPERVSRSCGFHRVRLMRRLACRLMACLGVARSVMVRLGIATAAATIHGIMGSVWPPAVAGSM